MMNPLGWKDILRPIRDGYRHLFPAPDTGPTPEERARQRELDRLKGFCYFDTFDQLEQWTEVEAATDTIQRSNTPLLERPDKDSARTQDGANVLICHDASGNYHEYENVQRTGMDEESYSCEYLQFTETFIYFSHKLACVPPPSWTNTLHRNGVKSLGTLLIEPQTKDTWRLLQHRTSSEENGKGLVFLMAEKLAAIVRLYGFDGWLINIEKPFTSEIWDSRVLCAFLEQLRDDLGQSKDLIWYDSLTSDNKVKYQNALNQQNTLFAKACGSILTNYCWTEADAQASRNVAQLIDLPRKKVFFGIDVWAQNPSSISHPRTTYPKQGGGGTNTGTAVAKLAEVGISAGIFAPAWSFEHFPGEGKAIEKTVWDGEALPAGLECSCGSTAQRHPPNKLHPMSYSASEFPAGSETFFFTDFSRAVARHTEEEGSMFYEGKRLHSQLIAQSVLPHLARTSAADNTVESCINMLSQRLEDLSAGTELAIDVKGVPKPKADHKLYERWLPLFKLNMASGPLQCRYTSRCVPFDGPRLSPNLYLKYNSGVRLLHIPLDEAYTVIDLVVRSPSEDSRLQEIGIHLSAPHVKVDVLKLVTLKEIFIRSISLASKTERRYRIDRPILQRHGQGETTHWRLQWCYIDDEAQALLGVPYSDTTGPFSHFLLSLNGIEIGRSYALAYIVPKQVLRELKNQHVKNLQVSITGVGFDGKVLACCRADLKLDARSIANT